ncbi:alpha-mannosidase 2C1-like [Patiria miniata]|uniref:alpha-mannosidase n=1 Tax=Patiria miniata TaxID=46514 RepID=A0A914B7L5_PATMI|nr:alpha-mannosidase 2C1-like [Patiria miniata]XP_038072172.1 alpha-mannosidase 2C1-like [Patiria miniata]
MNATAVFKNKRCTLERAEKFISDTYFTDVNLRGRLYPDKQPVTAIYHCAVEDRIPYHEAITRDFTKTEVGRSFGPTWATHWFRIEFAIPKKWSDKDEVRLAWNSNSEATVWQDGILAQGLNKDNHKDFILLGYPAGKPHSLYIEMACNGLFGAGSGLIGPPDPNKTFALSKVELVTFDRLVFDLIHDIETLVDMAKHIPETDQRSFQALYTVNSMVNICTVGNPDSYRQARQVAQKFFSQAPGSSCHTVHAMGHAHIDSAWLWPYAETVRKCARSWSTTLALMDRHPDYKFVCSQAQQYDWVRIHYPGLFERIRRSVQKDQFIPVGGVWVEMDGNLPSGESFVRQFLYGQRFFMKVFQRKCNVFWLPDTFGYSAQLPQIVREAGIEYFVTQKLSWSLINKFPHSTFWWEGIDGSRCLTHFPPADDYGTSAKVEDILKTVKGNKDKGRVNHSILLFGHGDGGGGPSEEMLARLERVKEVDGLPRVKQSTPVDFFESVVKEGTDNLCSWVGELYLELHQGTFTTQAKLKKYNRKLEFMLRNVELVHSLGLAIPGLRGRYPSDQLDHMWKGLLLNQFHDVLPGSCIKQVVEDAVKIYEDIENTASKLLMDGLQALCAASQEKGYYVFNPVSWQRGEVIALARQEDEEGPTEAKVAKIDSVIKDCEGKTLVLVDVLPMSLMSVRESSASVIPVQVIQSEGSILLENEHLVASIDGLGRVQSLWHREAERDAFKTCDQGSFYGNQFVLFDDIPLFWDAWDVMDYHLETRQPITKAVTSAQILDNNQLRCSIQTKLFISDKSWIEQVISLDSGCPYLKFSTKVEWHENHKFLKVEFPLNVRSSNATYDIQFGHLQRPTHLNTSWDSAKYEVVGHKWADMSEHGFGVALLNDCKYGHSCHGNIMRLSLLRSPKSPDPTADMGQHEFTYAIMPHTGSFQESGVIQQAYNLNNPLVVFPGSLPHQGGSYFKVDNPAVVIETVKKAEDNDNVVVMRLYEAFGGQAKATIQSSLHISRAVRCNILEEPTPNNALNGNEIKWVGRSVQLHLKPFQIVSLLLFLE